MNMAEKLIRRYSRDVKITETKDYIRLWVKASGLFRKGSTRTDDIGKEGFTKRLSGRLKSTGRWETQAFIFNKKDFGRTKALHEARRVAETYYR
jgi:hypothetical protein